MDIINEDITELLLWLNHVRRRHIDILKYIHEKNKFYVVKSGKTKSIYDPIDVMQLLHISSLVECTFTGGFTHWQYNEPLVVINSPGEINQETFFPQRMQPKKFALTPEEEENLKKIEDEYDYVVDKLEQVDESDRWTSISRQLELLSAYEMIIPLYKDRLEKYIFVLNDMICKAYSGVNKC